MSAASATGTTPRTRKTRLLVELQVLVVRERQALQDARAGRSSSPIARPAWPRASSRTSGFFFCGMRDEPVASASGSVDEAELVGREEDQVLGEAREVRRGGARPRRGTRRRRRGRRRRRASSPSGARSRGSARARRGRRAAACPRARREPSGHSSARASASSKPRRVAPQHLDVREAPVPERHRLGALQVGVAGHRRRGLAPRPARASASARARAADARLGERVLAVEPEVGRDLVVARAPGVQLARERRRPSPRGAPRRRSGRPRRPRRRGTPASRRSAPISSSAATSFLPRPARARRRLPSASRPGDRALARPRRAARGRTQNESLNACRSLRGRLGEPARPRAARGSTPQRRLPARPPGTSPGLRGARRRLRAAGRTGG